MQKKDLVESVAAKTGIAKTGAEKAINALLETITQSLKDGDKVTLVGFGTFSVSERASRTGRNPQTGKAIQIPASKVPKFKPGKVLKDQVA
jgi:DNA-binding protein HU-beta